MLARTTILEPQRSLPVLLRKLGALTLVGALALALTSCAGVTAGADDPSNRRLRMMIPNSPGGGYDLTGRAAVKVLEDDDLTGRFEVTNVLGASGTVAMQRLLNEKGADDLVMTMGLGVVGAVYTNKSEALVSKATPIARLVEEQEAILVPKDSPYKTVDDLVQAWKKDPGGVTVGGGSTNAAPLRTLGRKPPRLSWAEAAALPLAGLTAYQAINKALAVSPDDIVLVHAASGGVGSFADRSPAPRARASSARRARATTTTCASSGPNPWSTATASPSAYDGSRRAA